MAVLLFSGCDKVGKTTLFQAVLKKTNAHICVDRFTPCQHVYGTHHKREDTPSVEYLTNVELALEDYAGVVYVEAFLEDIIERFHTHNEKDIELEDIQKIINSYRNYVNNTPLPVLYLNTSILNIEECVSEIVKFGNWIDNGGDPLGEDGPRRLLF